MTGCAHSTYMIDRLRDAQDIITANAGYGIGGKIRIGPVIISPFLLENDAMGLRGGEFFSSAKGFPVIVDHGINDIGLLILNGEIFSRKGYDPNWPDEDKLNLVNQRGKAFETYDSFIPFLNIPNIQPVYGAAYVTYPFYYFTQIEAVLVLGPGFRLGFNPGELLDFVLGWTTMDIFNDDVAALAKPKENRSL